MVKLTNVQIIRLTCILINVLKRAYVHMSPIYKNELYAPPTDGVGHCCMASATGIAEEHEVAVTFTFSL